MFRGWREVGSIQINPMGLHSAGTLRKVNVGLAVAPDLYDLVLDAMAAEDKPIFGSRRSYVHDRFLFISLREKGLRASELVKATHVCVLSLIRQCWRLLKFIAKRLVNPPCPTRRKQAPWSSHRASADSR